MPFMFSHLLSNMSCFAYRYYCDYCDTFLTHDSVHFIVNGKVFLFKLCFYSPQFGRLIAMEGSIKKMSDFIIKNGWKSKHKI